MPAIMTSMPSHRYRKSRLPSELKVARQLDLGGVERGARVLCAVVVEDDAAREAVIAGWRTMPLSDVSATYAILYLMGVWRNLWRALLRGLFDLHGYDIYVVVLLVAHGRGVVSQQAERDFSVVDDFRLLG